MNVKNLRILFVHSGSDLYGASRSLLRLTSRLVSDGAAVKVVLPSDGPLLSTLKSSGVDVVIQRSLSVIERSQVRSLIGILQLLPKLFFSVVDLLKLIKQFEPSLIHTMTAVILSPGLAAKWTRTPHIWHVRESFAEFGKLWQYYQQYMVWLSTRIICVSTPIAEQFTSFMVSDKIQVIHNGFPAGEFSNTNAENVYHFRSQYTSAEVKYLVGIVGRIKFQRKGQDVFVKAASLLHDKFPDARFLCIGSPFPGNEVHLARLLELIRELNLDDYVIYTGDAEDIKAAIAALDILVLASAQPEPFAGVVIEAMALSRAVVATRIGGSVEQVVDGVTGYLVEPGDPASMAMAIERLLCSPEERQILGKHGNKRFLENFEFESFYGKIVEIYRQVGKKSFQEQSTI